MKAYLRHCSKYPAAVTGADRLKPLAGSMACRGLLLVWFLFCIAGCGKEASVQSAAPPPKTPIQADNSAIVKEFQARLERLLRPIDYRYGTTGKPDPFQPFLRTAFAPPKSLAKGPADGKKPSPPERCATALECIDIGQLTLVAIITKDNGMKMAMAQDAAGIGYLLNPGVRVGFRNGRVTDIHSDRVVVTEETEDIRGQATLQNRFLFLHPEER